jgi:MutS domain V
VTPSSGKNARAAASTARNPAEVYVDELNRLGGAQRSEQRHERLFGYSKLIIAVLTLVAAAFLRSRPVLLASLLVPVAAFIVLAVLQEKLLASIRYRTRAVSFYERGLARLRDGWAGTGETGERFLDPAHLYARDLDLFGRASLFEYLSSARTRAGEEKLAQWLLADSDPGEVLARQAAVRELEERVGFRERLFCSGETLRLGLHPEMLSAWGEGDPAFTQPGLRIVVSALAILWLLSLVAWAAWDLPALAMLMTVLNFGYSHRLHARLEKTAGSLEKAAQDLQLLAEVLALIEHENVSSPRLVAIQSALRTDGTAPSQAIGKLARLVDLLESRHSLFARPIDLVTFWSAQLIFVAEHWQRQHGPAIRGWMDAVGEFEALTSLSAFAYEHPQHVFPEFVDDAPRFEAQALAHPLLPAHNAVANDVTLSQASQLIILSGPNMAGKSTFIRCIGVNAVLAQCGAPVCAHRLRMSPLTVAASICILDSLAGGMSRFYAEIHRLKLISDLAQGPVPVLFLLDELLSGTNSHDRLIGTQFLLRNLVDHRAIGIVSTHDLALTQIPAMLGERATNCHFEDRLVDDCLSFDYKLRPGIVETSNALKLMRAIGLGVST